MLMKGFGRGSPGLFSNVLFLGKKKGTPTQKKKIDAQGEGRSKASSGAVGDRVYTPPPLACETTFKGPYPLLSAGSSGDDPDLLLCLQERLSPAMR